MTSPHRLSSNPTSTTLICPTCQITIDATLTRRIYLDTTGVVQLRNKLAQAEGKIRRLEASATQKRVKELEEVVEEKGRVIADLEKRVKRRDEEVGRYAREIGELETLCAALGLGGEKERVETIAMGSPIRSRIPVAKGCKDGDVKRTTGSSGAVGARTTVGKRPAPTSV
jgi:predicted RNase H-like nuclease (RuvC/YqgF family)